MSTLRQLVLGGGLLVLIAVGVMLGGLAWNDRLGPEITLPLLAIAGIVCLLMVLTLAAIVFAKVGLADKAQALALPEGSVRAVIALSLVVIFAIITVYLYGSLAKGCEVAVLTVDTIAEARVMQQRAARSDSDIEILSVEPPLGVTSDMGTGATSELIPTSDLGTDLTPKKSLAQEPPRKGPFTIRYSCRTSQQAADFAKQLLILIGTLVTSVSSFYFGSRAVESARSSTGGINSPTITAVSPSKLVSGKANEVTIAGTGLPAPPAADSTAADSAVPPE